MYVIELWAVLATLSHPCEMLLQLKEQLIDKPWLDLEVQLTISCVGTANPPQKQKQFLPGNTGIFKRKSGFQKTYIYPCGLDDFLINCLSDQWKDW